MGLFGDEEGGNGGPPARKAKAAKPKTDGAVPRCFARWHELFEGKWGTPPKHLAPGTSAGQFKRLVATYGEAEVLALMARFFASTEWRIVRSGYTVGDFYNAVPSLALADRRSVADGRTAENIDAASRATRLRQ